MIQKLCEKSAKVLQDGIEIQAIVPRTSLVLRTQPIVLRNGSGQIGLFLTCPL